MHEKQWLEFLKAEGATTVVMTSDNCFAQYKCNQDSFAPSSQVTFPRHESRNDVNEARHRFAQVYSFKGVWDASGKVVKDEIRRLEEESQRRASSPTDVSRQVVNHGM